MCIYVIPPLKINHTAVCSVNSLPSLYYIFTVSNRMFPYADCVYYEIHVSMYSSCHVLTSSCPYVRIYSVICQAALKCNHHQNIWLCVKPRQCQRTHLSCGIYKHIISCCHWSIHTGGGCEGDAGGIMMLGKTPDDQYFTGVMLPAHIST